MSVSGVSNTSNTGNPINPVPVNNDRTKMDQLKFLQLFLAEITTQDPLQPMDSKAMSEQLAQMNNAQAVQDMTSSMRKMQASNLVGKHIDGYDLDDKPVSGVVSSYTQDGEKIYLNVGGSHVELDKMVRVNESTQAGDLPQQAAMLVGKQIEGKDTDGKNIQGIVKGFTFEEGGLYLNVNGKRVELSSITSVSEPTTSGNSWAQATALIGREVQATNANGETIEGVVQSLSVRNDQIYVDMEYDSLPLSSVTGVK